jgi:glycosyltransferase involved in cell wall biosynthesis
MVLANTGFPPDIRVEKEASVLASADDEVLLLCRGDGTRPAEEQVGPVRAIRHRVSPDSVTRRRLDSARYLLTLDSPSWRAAMERLVSEHDVDAFHVHDLPYARSAILAARSLGVPVVLDLHENYPAALAIWRRRPIDRLLVSPSRAERLERWAVREADRVVVVVDEAKERVVGLGARPENVVVFGNSEPLSLLEAPRQGSDGRLALVYVGGVEHHRGLHTAVAAMPRILAARPDATLTIVGDGKTLGTLKEQAVSLGLERSVRFTGWLSYDDAMDEARAASIALIPHLRSPHPDATVPHKLFQYMSLGKPVVASDCVPLERIVGQTASGEIFRTGDAGSLADAVLSLAEPERQLAAGTAGQRAVRDHWNLESEGRSLIDMYEDLLRDGER